MGETKTREFKIEDLLGNVESTQQGPDIYSNYAQVTMTNNELIMDLFITGPIPGKREAVKITHIQRIVFPLPLADGLVQALQQTINSFRNNHIGEE